MIKIIIFGMQVEEENTYLSLLKILIIKKIFSINKLLIETGMTI
jgi:hypothetical protein